MDNTQLEIERLKNLVTSASTDLQITEQHEKEYASLRQSLLKQEEILKLAPSLIKTCSSLKEFRRELQEVSNNYAGRRSHIKTMFAPLIEYQFNKIAPNIYHQVAEKEVENEQFIDSARAFLVKKPSTNKMKRVFISHSSKDSKIVEIMIELLHVIGANEKQIFCTSFEGYGLKPGKNFLDAIKAEINDDVLVLFVLTKNFYDSPVCLCEMGATWVKSNEHVPVLIPPLDFEDIKGVFPQTQAIKLNNKFNLNSLKDTVEEFLNLSSIGSSVWERRRDNLLAQLNQLISITPTHAPIAAKETAHNINNLQALPSAEERMILLKEKERIEKIRPSFKFETGGASPQEFLLTLVNKGGEASKIKIQYPVESLAHITPIPQDYEVEAGGKLIIKGYADQSKTYNNSNQVPYQFTLSYEDIDGNTYSQEVERDSNNIKVGKPIITNK